MHFDFPPLKTLTLIVGCAAGLCLATGCQTSEADRIEAERKAAYSQGKPAPRPADDQLERYVADAPARSAAEQEVADRKGLFPNPEVEAHARMSPSLDEIEPAELRPVEQLHGQPSVLGLDRSNWSRIVTTPEDQMIRHPPTYFRDAKTEGTRHHLVDTAGSRDEVEVQMMAALAEPQVKTLSKRNGLAMVRQPLKFAKDLILLPVHAVKQPPNSIERSPMTLERTAIDYTHEDAIDYPDSSSRLQQQREAHDANTGDVEGHKVLREIERR